jgi:hypothetical protein
MTNFVRNFLLGSFALFVFMGSISAAPVVRTAAGANAAAIQAAVDQFRADLGGANNGVGGSFTTGRREINWDAVPNTFSAPNLLPANFFNSNSPRGVVFTAVSDFNGQDRFAVSANAASGTAVRFGNVNASYSAIFQTFSPERLFIANDTNNMGVDFFIPGTKIQATVSGFGVIFTDVDNNAATVVRFYAADGSKLAQVSPTAANNGLSFVGVSFNAGERVARVVITSGNAVLAGANNDGANNVDVVAMDDFIYGEPRAASYHPSDFDGDGATDRSVFRPSNGQWYIFNSGTNTLTGGPFGAQGDIPLEGDFDGDSRSDLAIYRPTTGQWIILRSSNNSVQFLLLGSAGDVPVPGDYDKDGITDPAVWRASTTGWFFLRSSANFSTFDVIGFGIAGDKPVPAPDVP